jgi:hypothetical protein
MAVGLLAIAVILVVVLSQKAQRRSGTDLTPDSKFVATLVAGEQSCQGAELLPADTAAVRTTITAFGHASPPLQLVFTASTGRVLSSGALAAGWRAGVVQIPIGYVAHASEGTTACLRNLGPAPIAIAGAYPDPQNHMTVGRTSVEGRLRYDYFRRGHESWWQLLPTIAYRWTLAKAGVVRHWAWAAVPVLMLFAIGLAALTLVREESS